MQLCAAQLSSFAKKYKSLEEQRDIALEDFKYNCSKGGSINIYSVDLSRNTNHITYLFVEMFVLVK